MDASTKQLLRELNARIRTLSESEQLRQNTEATVRNSHYGRLRLGALGAWAAGGLGHSKSPEQELEEAQSNLVKTHRESVLWYLRRKLQDAGEVQTEMMGKRIGREMEKRKGMLAGSGALNISGSFHGMDDKPMQTIKIHRATPEDGNPRDHGQVLSEEQVQMFEEQNQEMLKHYQSTLDQVK